MEEYYRVPAVWGTAVFVKIESAFFRIAPVCRICLIQGSLKTADFCVSPVPFDHNGDTLMNIIFESDPPVKS